VPAERVKFSIISRRCQQLQGTRVAQAAYFRHLSKIDAVEAANSRFFGKLS
jgi:hypothetical protein